MEQLPQDLGQLALDYKSKEDSMYAEIKPVAIKMFSVGPLNQLVDAFNKLSPAFGLEETYPKFTAPVKEFPLDFVKQLSMVKKATDDAIEEDVVDASASLTLADVTTDNAVRLLASKVEKLSKDRMFKQWLGSQEKPSEEMPEAPEAPVSEGKEASSMNGDDLMGLLSSRMK